jgi:hypothetical protein
MRLRLPKTAPKSPQSIGDILNFTDLLYILLHHTIQSKSTSRDPNTLSMAAFRPHGLIRTPIQQQLYFKAHIANIYAGISDPKEPETVALMEVILSQNIFTEPYFVVNSQYPPNPTSARRCDLVVRYLETGDVNIKTLIFAECKRTRTTQAFSLEALEDQAADYCKLYLDYENEIESPIVFVHAITAAGANVRFWKCSAGSGGWRPLWGANHRGDWSQYKDVGDDAAGLLLGAWFRRMKQTAPSLHAGQSLETYGTLHQAGQPSHTSASGFQVAPSGYQTGSYPTSFSAANLLRSNAPTGQYTHPVPAAQANPNGEEDEEHEEDEGGQYGEGDVDMGGDDHTAGNA